MFTHSTNCLRGCLHRKPVISNRCGCRLEARFHDSSQSALQDRRALQDHQAARPSLPREPTAAIHPFRSPKDHVHATDSTHSQWSEGSTPRSWEIPPTVEPRVTSIRSPSAEARLWSSNRGPEDVERRVTKPSGTNGRSISKHLEARNSPRPQPSYDLQPVGLGRSNSPRWSFPPGRKSIRPESGILRQLKSVQFKRVWGHNYFKLFETSRNGNIEKARQFFDVYRQVAISLVGDHSLEELQQVWNRLPARDHMHLASILLGCLVDSPRRTLLMLSLDIEMPNDWRHRSECLCYLDMVYRDEIVADTYLQELFARQIKRVSRIWTWPEDVPMHWHFLVLLLRHNKPEHCENIIDTVFESARKVPPRVILVMVDHLTKRGDVERALEMLSLIPPEQREEHKVRILERCANLISIDTIEKSDSVGNFRALPTLIGLGLPMDSKVHNRILARALELGVPEVAWEVFRFMEVRDIHVDTYSHLLLLKDSFERNIREKLDAMMSAIHGRADLYQYPYLVTYMMHIVRVVCTIDRNLAPEKSVSHLLAVYDRAYDRTPLVKLGIVDALPAEIPSRVKLEQPPPAVLGFTIWAYVLCQRDERLVSALWFWIIHMIKQQDETVLACAKHDIMWNGFIHFYARSRFFLRKAVDVVETMIEHSLCMPTERTWSEVLCGFMKHGEEETAAKIWQMMLARDVHPTEKGWAFLLEKYDETQLADLVKYVLDERRMPTGVGKALGWPKADTTSSNTEAEAKATEQANSEYSEDDKRPEMFEDATLGGGHAVLAPAEALVHQQC